MIPLKSPKTLAMREEVELDTLSKWVKLNTPSNSQTEEEFEDTKGVIIICKSKKNRQHNDQKKKYKRTNNDLQNKHIKLKIE
jgi:hypothetical protein